MTTATEMSAEFLADDPTPKGVMLESALAELVHRIEAGKPIIETLPTGVPLIDETTGGLVRGEYLGMAAGPGDGKSTIADYVCLGALRKNPAARALVFNLETATQVRAARLVAGQSVRVGEQNHVKRYVPLKALLLGTLESTARAHAREVATALSQELGGRLRFIDDVLITGDIAAVIRRDVPDLVIVDHLGLVTLADAGNGSTVDCFDDSLHLIQAAIRDVNAAGILINEVNKLGLAAGAADMWAIRGSARFASLAGMMMGIVRDPNHIGDDPRLLLQLHKNRHGKSRVQQSVVFYGGMSYLCWSGSTEPIPVKQPSKGRGRGAVG